MRRVNYLWVVLAAACGVVLFHTSQRVTDGREQLASIDRDIAKEQESTRVLEAEWSYLNQPDRLEKLSRQYLHLEPMRGKQFASVEKLDAAPAESSLSPRTSRVGEGQGEGGGAVAPKVAESASSSTTPLPPTPRGSGETLTSDHAVASAKAGTPTLSHPQERGEREKIVLKPATVSPLAAASMPKPHLAQKKPAKQPAHAVAKAQPQRNFNDGAPRDFNQVMKSLGVN